MKTTLAYLFLSLIVLNVVGYYGVFIGLQYQNSVSLHSRFEVSDFSYAETITLRIPLVRPYAQDDGDFSGASGELEYGGEFYQLMKQKFAHDTLTVVCFRDQAHKQIQGALTEYVHTFSDHASEAQQKNALPAFIKDYMLYETILFSSCKGWASDISGHPDFVFLTHSYLPSILHPPERC